MRAPVWLLAVAVALGACDLYLRADAIPDAASCGGGGGTAGGGGGWTGPRDPTTGLCDEPPFCGCAPCPGPDAAPLPSSPVLCGGSCSNLDENTCLATTGCHPAYVTQPEMPASPQPVSSSFSSCWDIQPTAIVEGGTCFGLDARACAVRDDCVSVMATPDAGFSFQSCSPKPTAVTACLSKACAAHAECNVVCDAQGACAAACVPAELAGTCTTSTISCNTAPPPCPVDTEPGVVDGCWGGACMPQYACGTTCSTLPQFQCEEQGCTAVFAGAGSAGSTCNCVGFTGNCTCTGAFEYCE